MSSALRESAVERKLRLAPAVVVYSIRLLELDHSFSLANIKGRTRHNVTVEMRSLQANDRHVELQHFCVSACLCH